VDESTQPPQKLVLRTVRAEYTHLAGNLCGLGVLCGQTKSVLISEICGYIRVFEFSWQKIRVIYPEPAEGICG
jgi:hypothetical protein